MSLFAIASTRPVAGATLPMALVGFGVACVLCVALCLVVVRVCRRWGLLDRPEPRRVHTTPVPRLGGLALFLTFALVSFALYRPANAYERHVYTGLLVASVLIVTVMAWDDVRGLPPIPRLFAQVLAALIAMFPAGHGALIEVLHNPLTTSHHGRTLLPAWIAVPFTLFWIVGMMNTINWVDGVDGLAGGVVTITALAMAVISWLLGQYTTALLCAILAGATLGFLLLNWHPARLFMGDCGAMFLGLTLAILSNTGGAKLVTMLLLLALPIGDAARVVLRRVRDGRSPLQADRSHMHHRLLAGGFTQRQVALLFYAVTATFGSLVIVATALQANGDLLRLSDILRRVYPGVLIASGVIALIALGCGGWLALLVRKARHAAQAASASDAIPR